ncbi:MAG: transporter substrate-binding domain-containing protein [Spirochaetales bacterium]|jgi:polar amino acid transport system substrate-binding protein|nr:transporter substrate-binding domain-containing protein [Spirochaetales bacterium]
MTRKQGFRTGIVFAAVMLMILAGCGDSSDEGHESSQLDKIVKSGKLQVGMDTFEPWAMKDKNGKLIGFEIDVATRLAEDMGVEIEFVPTQWSGIIPALIEGKFDVIIGGMGITPSRNLKVNFSIPYDYTGMAIVASKTLAPGLSSLEDFNEPGMVVTAKLGTTAAQAAKKYMPLAEHRLFDNEALAVQEILNGNAHALVASAPLPAYRAVEYPDKLYVPLPGTFTFEPIGFAVQKGDFDLLNYYNNWITIVEAEGWLAERKHYWFATQDWKSQIE